MSLDAQCSNVFAPSAGRTAGLKAGRLVGLWGKNTGSSAPGADWRVGLARTCITPEPPGWLYGYGCKPRHRDFAGKLQDLHAKALAIEDARGHRAILITLDLCVLRARQAAALRPCSPP